MAPLIQRPIRPSLSSVLLLIFFLSPFHPAFAAREKLALRYLPLPLPGAPSAVVAADVDGDGHRDLTVVVAFTRWSQIEIEESAKMDDVEGLVEVLTVIPSLVDRREIRVFPGRPDGGFGPGSVGLPIDASILTIEAGPPGLPVVAMTDDGISALRMKPGASGPPELSWEPVFHERSVLAGTGTFLPNLGLVHDVDGDGRADVLFPTTDGMSVYLSGPEGLRTSPASRVRFPLDDLQGRGNDPLVRRFPLPDVRDVDGDRLPDLVLFHPAGGLRGFRVLRNLGGGRFGEPVAPLGDYKEEPPDDENNHKPEPAWFGDLDGDGKAEYVTQEEKGPGEDAGFRKEMAAAKRPHFIYRLYRSRADLAMEPKPYQQFEVEGYALGGSNDEGDIRLPGGFEDLNGDGRQDLILTTLDFSLFQAVKIMTVQRIGLGLDFHLWCQAAGGFRPVPGLDLSGKFNLNLNNLKIGHISQFEGDFDGDGRPEFVQMGRGRTVTIHRGRPDCGYNAQPDLTLELEEEPRDLSLAQIRDLDGDGLSDLLVIQPQPVRNDDKGVTQPVRLDLYLSGGAR
ncbi:MAG TPA: VCBS repeat-containing protein [Thermoanaerobaculia bacterium]|nr:VCBS repeat-containing protein [Thermoanaerobaculia bacterium]